MKIAFSSDHHFHSYGPFAKTLANGINSRLQELLDIEDALGAQLQELGCEVHVRAGDLFDRKNLVDVVVFSEVHRRIRLQHLNGIRQILLVGNHDLAAGGLRNSVETLASDGLVSIPGPGVATLDLDTARLHLFHYTDDVPSLAKLIQDTDLPGDRCNVLVAHVTPQGCMNGSEFALPFALTHEQLRPNDFDHVLLGHIHQPQSIGVPAIHVIGSMGQRSFADQGKPRRFLMLDTETGELTSHELPGPQFQTVDVASLKDVTDLRDHARHPDADRRYLLLHLRSNEVNVTKVRAAMEGVACLGWTWALHPDVQAASPEAPRMSLAGKSWHDVCCEYQTRTAPGVDAQLLRGTLGEIEQRVGS